MDIRQKVPLPEAAVTPMALLQLPYSTPLVVKLLAPVPPKATPKLAVELSTPLVLLVMTPAVVQGVTVIPVPKVPLPSTLKLAT